jgi:GrpB-like predicted nucleotidyltransferase (UPF0157 family)
MWPKLFEVEKKRLLLALGEMIIEIEHIGSTSITGMAAKPLIDMMATVNSFADYKSAIEPLKKLGYEYIPERVFTDRVFFPKGPSKNRTYHLSIVEKNSKTWNDALSFRDYIRANKGKREEYLKLKEKLAKLYANDRTLYTKGKEAFIESVLELAKK